MRDALGAFCEFHDVVIPGRGDGPLAGLSFAVKDVFDIAGERVGAGNPDFLRDQKPAATTAPVVQKLLDAGAAVAGKTNCDELCFSLEGENDHYGTPVNPNAPGRIPGGSSSGSASAVAGKLVDFALGTDTGGSVRLPASLCGLYGLRTTHGRVSRQGMVPLSSSFDTVGWFARDTDVMERVGTVLLGNDTTGFVPRRLLIPTDLTALADPEAVAAVQPAIERIAGVIGAPKPVTVCADGIEAWLDCRQTIQSVEAWAAHGRWIESAKPRFGERIAARLKVAASVDPARATPARETRTRLAASLHHLLDHDGVLCLPTGPGIAPLCATPMAALDPFRIRALQMLGISGVAGTPQINLPVATVQGCPVGLSLIGPRGSDRALLSFVTRLALV